jgi:CheY-like chemotaxis protein
VEAPVTGTGNGSGGSVYDTPSEIHAEEGLVLIDGPNGLALTMTPGAASETARRLVVGADEALQQSRPRSYPPSTDPYALVVDDDALVLMNACDILEAAGFRFFEAENAEAAIAVLQDNAAHVSLLFTDVEMPGDLNGFALAHHVAIHWPDIEIVVASGRMQPAEGDMPTKASFIPKPFNDSIVHAHLRKVLPEGKKPTPLKAPV